MSATEIYMDMKYFCKMKNIYGNNKGLSAIVATVILILLVIVATTVVWTVVTNLVKDKTEGVTTCFDVSFEDKLSLNNDYTCYDFDNNETQFSLSIGDLQLQKVLVSISYGGTSKTFELTNTPQELEGLVSYPARNTTTALPGANSGLTYIATGIYSQPDWIKISPYIEDKQCETVDTIYQPVDCALFG